MAGTFWCAGWSRAFGLHHNGIADLCQRGAHSRGEKHIIQTELETELTNTILLLVQSVELVLST